MNTIGFNEFFPRAVSHRMMTGDDDMINKYTSILDWRLLSRQLQPERLDVMADRLHWPTVSMRVDLTKEFIHKHRDELHWHHITANYSFTREELRRFDEYIDWHIASKTQVLEPDMVNAHADEVDWASIARCQHFTDDFWISNSRHIRWSDLSGFQYVSSYVRNHYRRVQPPREYTTADEVLVSVAFAKKKNRSLIDRLMWWRDKGAHIRLLEAGDYASRTSVSLLGNEPDAYVLLWRISYHEFEKHDSIRLEIDLHKSLMAWTSLIIHDTMSTDGPKQYAFDLKADRHVATVYVTTDETKIVFGDNHQISMDKTF